MEKQGVFSPIRKSRAFEEVSEEIKKLIFDGVLKPGDRLPSESQLAQQFGVGRQTTREALRLLELSGFITIQKGGNGGAFIKDTIHATIRDLFLDAFRMHKASIEELTQARLELERPILRQAVKNHDADDIAALKKNVAQAAARLETGRTATEENIHFHRLIAKASKNFVFVIIMECIMAVHSNILTDKEPSLETSRNVLMSHQELLDALETRDIERAEELFGRHLLDVRNRLLSATGESTSD